MSHERPLVLGLHVAKTAGSTLMLHFNTHMRSDRVAFCSTFADPRTFQTAQLPEYLSFDRLHLVFGHYIHESLALLAGARGSYIFLGLRDPERRMMSAYYHANTVRMHSGLDFISADDFLAGDDNMLCMEITRAFPKLSECSSPRLIDRAWHTLQHVNYIYSTSDLPRTIKPICTLLDIPNELGGVDNVTPPEILSNTFLRDNADHLRASMAERFAADIELYARAAPHVGKVNPFGNKSRHRDDILADRIADPRQALRKHLATFLVSEFLYMDQIDRLREWMGPRREWLSTLDATLAEIKGV